MSNSTQNHIPYVPENTLDPAAGLNDAIRVVDALLNTRVENMTQNAPTTADSVDGACFIVGAAPTGEWAGHAKALAQYTQAGDFWTFFEAGVTAWLLLNKADGNLYKYNTGSGAWELAAGIGEAPLDSELYGRRNGTWFMMPDLSNIVLSINDVGPDTSGNIEIPAGDVLSVNGEEPDTSGNVAITPVGQLKGRLDAVLDSSGSVTMQDAFGGYDVWCTDGSAATFNIDTQANVPTRPQVWCFASQGGAGVVTVAALAGVTLRTPNGDATLAQYDARGVQHISGDEWRVW